MDENLKEELNQLVKWLKSFEQTAYDLDTNAMRFFGEGINHNYGG